MRRTKPKFRPAEKDTSPADSSFGTGIYKLKGRIWIDGPEGTYLGVGRIALLEKIKECGSISEAARSMDMSYRHAWDLLDSMKRQARKPLFIAGKGGKKGGGTVLTTEGERAIISFWKINERFRELLKKEMKNLTL